MKQINRIAGDDFPGLNRIERKKDEIRKKIIDVAMDLFRTQGFDTTTMEQIAEETDIAKKTLYNHFPVKEAILDEYVRRSIKEEKYEKVRQLQDSPDTRSRLLLLLNEAFAWAKSKLNRELLEIYTIYRFQNALQLLKDQTIRIGFNSLLIQIIEMGQETGEIRRDIQARMLAYGMQCFYTTTVMCWLADPEKFSVKEGIIQNVDIFLNGAQNLACPK